MFLLKFWSNNFQTEFVSPNPPTIFYDHVRIYHITVADGCYYKCHFTTDMGILKKGDAAVFSGPFNVNNSIYLRKRGVLVVFETGEAPYVAPKLKSVQLGQVSTSWPINIDL